MASVIKADASKEQRDRAIRRAGVGGFLFGVGFYLIALAAQIGSTL